MARASILLIGVIAPAAFPFTPALASEAADRAGPVALPDATRADASLPQPLFGSPSGTAAPFTGGAVVDEGTLAGVTGMADLRLIEQAANVRNTSTISGNIINGDPITGTISFDGGSFGAFNGLALVSANTGNNVSINSAMNVNVAIQ